MIERLSYDPSSLVDERGDVVPAADFSDDDVQPKQDFDADAYVDSVMPFEAVKPDEVGYRKALAEYENLLESLAEKLGGYDIANRYLANSGKNRPNPVMFGLPHNYDEAGGPNETGVKQAEENAVAMDALERSVNSAVPEEAINRSGFVSEAQRAANMKKLRNDALRIAAMQNSRRF